MMLRVARDMGLVMLTLVLLMGIGAVAPACARESQGIYFSQGQAVFNPQDKAKSQQDAIRDFLAQGVMQASATFLSPAQMGTAYGKLQEKVLARPDRYVETYKVFSESEAGGLYRVTGQVTVALDILRKDLVGSGVMVNDDEASEEEPSERNEPAEEARAAAGTDAEPPSGEPAGENMVASAAEDSGQEGQRGIRLARQELLWAVTEHWDQDWVLPRDLRDGRATFALSVARELEDYDWDLRFSESAPLSMDETGNVSVSQALGMARSAGIPYVVVGTVLLKQRQNEPTRLEATLRVLNVASGRSRGEVHKQRQIGDGSNQEGALDLASMIIPQLDAILREDSAGEATGQARSVGSGDGGGGSGLWTLSIHFDHQYGSWEEIERLLRERFKTLQVRGLELNPDAARVAIDGVDGNGLRSLDGVQLAQGAKVQLKAYSAEQRLIEIVLVPSGNPQ